MQINSVASPSVSNDSVTRTSTEPATPTPTQSAQLAEDSVQLSAAAVSETQEQSDLGLNVGGIFRPPP